MFRARRHPPRRLALPLLFALLLWGATAQGQSSASAPSPAPASAPAQALALPAFAQPYPDDSPVPVELYPRVAPGHVVRPGDADWPLGPVRARGFSYAVLVDAAVRTPEGRESFRVDYDFPPSGPGRAPSTGPAPMLALEGELACLKSGVKRDAAKTRGIQFAIRGAVPARALLTINASHGGDQRRVDRFHGAFAIGTEWKTVRIPFRSMAVSAGWRDRLAARAGLLPGDGVLRPDRIEEIRIGLEPEQAPQGRGSFWVGDVTFFP